MVPWKDPSHHCCFLPVLGLCHVLVLLFPTSARGSLGQSDLSNRLNVLLWSPPLCSGCSLLFFLEELVLRILLASPIAEEEEKAV